MLECLHQRRAGCCLNAYQVRNLLNVAAVFQRSITAQDAQQQPAVPDGRNDRANLTGLLPDFIGNRGDAFKAKG